MGLPNTFTRALAVAAANNVSASQSPAAGAILINGSAASGGVATLDIQRRIIITSGGNDSGINFTVKGTNQAGFPISDTFAGTNAGVAQSNLDFLTVTAVTASGSVASTITVGTNTVGSSLWQIINWNAVPTNLTIAVELRSGAVNYTVEHTYDDPNILPGTGGLNAAGLTYPRPWPDQNLNGATATGETAYQVPILAWRLTTNSGTGTLVCRALQSGLGSP
jgi:hypothetical protein